MQKAVKINLNGVSIYLLVIEPEMERNYLKTLTKKEFLRYNSIRHPHKKLEFAASRFLKHELFGNEEINYLEHGTPFITGHAADHHISISHSNLLTGIAESNDFPVAMDIELITDKSLRLAQKFCSDSEKEIFNISSVEEMTLLWSFKETLYKLSDRNGLIFKNHRVVPKGKKGCCGKVTMTSGFLYVDLGYIGVDNFYLTCNHSYRLLHENS